MRFLLVLVLVGWVSASGQAGLTGSLLFTGTCDPSTAIAMGGDLFVVANDEDNVLRFYRASRPGKPMQTCNLGAFLFDKQQKSLEADLGGAAQLGERVFFCFIPWP